MVTQEVKIWEALGEHDNVVRYIDAELKELPTGSYMYILCDLCEGGHLLDLLEKYKGKLQEK